MTAKITIAYYHGMSDEPKNNNPDNLITIAIEIAGLVPLAKACGVSYQSVRKWERNGALPHTAYSGLKKYADIIEALTNGAVLKKDLLNIN